MNKELESSNKVVFSHEDIDKVLLMDLFKISSPSRTTKIMSDYIQKFLNDYYIPYSVDDIGNIYYLDYKDAPLLSSHIDTIQKASDLKKIDKISYFSDKEKNDVIVKGEGIIGADDKFGVYLCLKLLKHFNGNGIKNINFIFSVDEEIGIIGAYHIGKNLGQKIKDNCLYGLVFDRWGSTDIICSQNDYGTLAFEEALEDISDKYSLGMNGAIGVASDANSYRDYISCANVCVGYYNHHTEKEWGSLNELAKAFFFSVKTIEEVTNKFEAAEKRVYAYNNKSYNKYNYNYYKDYYGKTKKSKRGSYTDYGYGHGYDYDDVYYDGKAKGFKFKSSTSYNYELEFESCECNVCNQDFSAEEEVNIYETETYGYVCEDCLKNILLEYSTALSLGPANDYIFQPMHKSIKNKSTLSKEDEEFFKDLEGDLNEKDFFEERDDVESAIEEILKEEK